MGRKLNLSGLTEGEAEHVLEVVQRDMRLRKQEDERLSELRQELDEEAGRCSLLLRQHRFNQRCCIRCCSLFSFLLNPRRQCLDCLYNVCKACRAYSKRDRAWLCTACQKTRLLKTQSLEWYYNNVKSRFKRFGSAKVLKNLYRKNLAEHGTLVELTEGSTYEESIDNEGSSCGSDSAFYQQSEEHSMAETLTVALRVAEEAIDDAVSKAEFHTDNQGKQKEVHYLREHREELIEELVNTIVKEIIRRRKNQAEVKPECDLDWSPDQPFTASPGTLTAQTSLQASLWKSRSAFSLLDKNPAVVKSGQKPSQQLTKEGEGPSLINWKSVDRLDNSSTPSVLKSPDGSWMALHSAQLSRPSLLTNNKSLVSVLDRESGVAPAYGETGSATGGAVLPETHTQMNTGAASPWRQSIIDIDFNPEVSSEAEELGGDRFRRSRKRRRNIQEQAEGWRDEVPLSSSVAEYNTMLLDALVKNGSGKKESQSFSDPKVDASNGEITEGLGGEAVDQQLTSKLTNQVSVTQLSSTEHRLDQGRENDGTRQDTGARDGEQEEDERLQKLGVDVQGGRAENGTEEKKEEREGEKEQEIYDRCSLATQSRATTFSSTEDELERVGRSRGEEIEDEGETEGKTEEPTYKLHTLTRQVRANQSLSMEDELDRLGLNERDTVGEREEEREEEGDGEREVLTSKLCRLDSTEDELDRVGGSKGEKTEGRAGKKGIKQSESLWFMGVKTEGEGGMLKKVERRAVKEEGEMELGRIISDVTVALDEMEEEMDTYAASGDERCEEMEGRSEEGKGEEGEEEDDKNGMVEEESDSWEREEVDERENIMTVVERDIGEREDMSHTGEIEERSLSEKPVGSIASLRNKETPRETDDDETEVVLFKMVELVEAKVEKMEEEVDRKAREEDEALGESKDKNERHAEQRERDPEDDRAMELKESTPSAHHILSPEEIQNVSLSDLLELQRRYSAVSLSSITAEVLKVLNATEDLLQGMEGGDYMCRPSSTALLPPNIDTKKLDEQLSRLEENVYVAAGTAYGLEAELGDLEECARGVSGATSEEELAFMEDQVASAAAQVQQSELQVSDIAARITALNNASLKLVPQNRFAKPNTKPTPQTLDSSRQFRRQLPPPH